METQQKNSNNNRLGAQSIRETERERERERDRVFVCGCGCVYGSFFLSKNFFFRAPQPATNPAADSLRCNGSAAEECPRGSRRWSMCCRRRRPVNSTPNICSDTHAKFNTGDRRRRKARLTSSNDGLVVAVTMVMEVVVVVVVRGGRYWTRWDNWNRRGARRRGR